MKIFVSLFTIISLAMRSFAEINMTIEEIKGTLKHTGEYRNIWDLLVYNSEQNKNLFLLYDETEDS